MWPWFEGMDEVMQVGCKCHNASFRQQILRYGANIQLFIFVLAQKKNCVVAWLCLCQMETTSYIKDQSKCLPTFSLNKCSQFY